MRKSILLFIIIFLAGIVIILSFKKSNNTINNVTAINQEPNTDIMWFPRQKPQFEAVIKKDSYVLTDQEAISIYYNGKKVFSAGQFDDGFKGNTLTYQFYDDRPSFIQDGDLGMIGCGQGCAFSFSNYYIWNDKTQTFEVDNAAWYGEKNSFLFDDKPFQKYQDQYNSLDKSGCLTNITKKYQGLTYSQIYQKFPDEKLYCDKQDFGGVSLNTLVYFLKAKKAVDEVIQGKNIKSNVIANIPL